MVTTRQLRNQVIVVTQATMFGLRYANTQYEINPKYKESLVFTGKRSISSTEGLSLIEIKEIDEQISSFVLISRSL